MKFFLRYLITICAFWGFSFMAQAQSHYDGSIYLGAKSGVTISRVFFNPGVPQKMALGAMAGVTFRYIEENNFGIVAELNFEQRGWEEKFDETNLSYKRTLNYIQLPVFAHIFFPISNSKIFLNLGPEIGYMIGDKISSDFDYKNISSIPDFPGGRQVDQLTLPAKNKLDFGISGGLGYELRIKNRNSLAFEGRFYYGLGNLIDCGRIETFRGANSMSVMATLSYMFKVK